MRRLGAVLVAAALAGCGSGSHGSAAPPRTPPDLDGFLRSPVATPTSCPPSVNGSTVGRRSPWVGHIDVSVFLSEQAPADTIRALGRALRGMPAVQRVYFESRHEAYEEFRRLYTCSAQVPPAQVPASYRLILTSTGRGSRDALVRRIARLPGVSAVSCDPSDPCTGAAAATPTSTTR